MPVSRPEGSDNRSRPDVAPFGADAVPDDAPLLEALAFAALADDALPLDAWLEATPLEPPAWLTPALSDGAAWVDPSEPTLLDVLVNPNDAMAWAAVTEPGAATAAALAAVDRDRLSEKGRTDLLLAVTRQQAWTAAQAHRALAVIEAKQRELADVVYPDGKYWVVEQVRTALKVCPDEARTLLVEGTALTEQLPTTLALLESGQLSDRKARRLFEEVIGMDPAVVPEFERLVLDRAPEQSFAAFKRTLTRRAAILAPKTAEASRQYQMSKRRVVFTPKPNGMSEVWALLPSEGARAVYAAVRALAGRDGPDDTRLVAQREADGLVEMATWVLHQDCLPRQQGLRPQIQVTMTLETLLGLSELPADLDGVGPLPAAVARQLAYDPTGTWRRLIVDPVNGRCLDYGRTTYEPPADLREHLIAANRTCVFPGCARNARRCDLDHHLAWTDGGATADANMGPLCSRHHHLKHETGWRMAKSDDGYTWTDPTGHVYTSRPDPYPVIPPDSGPPTASHGRPPEALTSQYMFTSQSMECADDPPPF